MKVAAVQHDIVWEDPDANFARLAPMIADAADEGARLVALTELYATGFSLETARTAEPPGGASEEFIADQAVAQGVWVGASMPVRDGTNLPFNRFVLAGPAGERYHYDKIHPFSYGHEDEHYAAGDGRVTVDIEGVRVTLFVCYDLRFADEFWATAAATDAYLVVANWPDKRRHHWQSLLVARAIENQAYVVGVNRVGSGDGLNYAGDSRIVDPMGEILAAGAGQETLLLAEIDPLRVREARETLPFMRDRRKGVD